MIDIVRGDTCYLIFAIHTALDADGNPLSSLSGVAFRLQARLDADADSVVFEKSTAAGNISINGMNVRVRIDGSDTSSLVPGTILQADLQAETGGRIFTVDVGEQPLRLRVVADVTR